MNDQQFRQRVIYSALSRLSTDRAVIRDAFEFWEGKLLNERLDVLKTVDLLVNFLGLGTLEKKRLMLALHAANNKLPEELAEVPGFVSGSAETDGVANPQTNLDEVKTASAHIEVTEYYLSMFVKNVRKADPGEFIDFAKSLIEEELEELSSEVNGALKKWARSNFIESALPDSTSKADCVLLTHELYQRAAEFIGPNATDEVVTRSIGATLDIEASTRFSPKEFS